MNSDSSNTEKTSIPTSGRIGRLAKAIEKVAGRQVLLKVMKDVDQYESTSDYSKKAAWIKGAIECLEKLVGVKKSRKIMESCGRKCCGLTTRKNAKKLMKDTKSIEEFINKLNKAGIGGGRLQLKDKNTITGGYDRCYCGQVKKTKQPFLNTTYCNCSIGWYKQLFESSLEKQVEVEINQSIISGAKSCEFIIRI